MGTAPGAGYFQRGSLFWFTVITVSFTYYTVKPASGRHGWRSRTGVPELSLGNRLARLTLQGGKQVLPHNPVFRALKMVVAKSEVRRDAATYFRAARPWPSLITVLGLGYFAWVVFWPQSVPYQSLGPLGPFTKYLVDHHHTLLRNGYWLACLIHVGESIYAMVLCKHKGITDGQAQLLWFLQTFLFGIASLSILIAYRPKPKNTTEGDSQVSFPLLKVLLSVGPGFWDGLSA